MLNEYPNILLVGKMCSGKSTAAKILEDKYGYTRIGFAINETDKNLRIRVGEITGKKEEISIKF